MEEEGGEGDKERAERYLSELRYIITVEGTRRAGDNSSVEYVSKSRERKPFSSPRLIVHRVRYTTWNFYSAIYRNNTRSNLRVMEIQVEIHAMDVSKRRYLLSLKESLRYIALEYFSSFEDTIFFFFFFFVKRNYPLKIETTETIPTESTWIGGYLRFPPNQGRKISLCENSKVDIGSRTFTQQVLRNAWKTFSKN